MNKISFAFNDPAGTILWNNVTTEFQLHFNVVQTSDACWGGTNTGIATDGAVTQAGRVVTGEFVYIATTVCVLLFYDSNVVCWYIVHTNNTLRSQCSNNLVQI